MNVCLLAFVVLALGYSDHVSGDENSGHFLNEWAVEIKGGERQARSVAAQHGYTLVSALKSLKDHYILQRLDVPHRSRRSADHHTSKLSEDHRVTFVAQQQLKSRVKREAKQSREVAREIALEGGELHDPELRHEWYLNPLYSETNKADTARRDLRVKDCWEKGITGKGVVVTILDDGIERSHPDLQDNYDSKASYDFNDNDDDPTPRYDPTNENKHGTRCGGEVAMVANNNDCGTGIAFDAKIGGIRMLDGHVTDRLEGDALAYSHDHVDIYSASWGPNDDGKTTEGPGILATKAIEKGIKEGRNGKGNLYVWASGNGGRIGDNCNSDGYVSSIYTMSISSASQYGNSPWYSEKCSSTLATTYSSGNSQEGKVTSADLHGKCTNAHSGTSAAAPMAAGIYALLLEANQNLTWRDVQHITVHTSRMEPMALEPGWYKNGAGYCVNHAFGFGLMDALAMVELADPATWQSVGEQHVCKVVAANKDSFPQTLTSGHQIEVEFTTDGCDGQANEVNFLEHVQLILDLPYSRRGNIYAELESPSGTITPVMLERKYDTSNKGFSHWPLTSTHTWGERSNGTWKFRVADRTDGNETGSLNDVELVLYGTEKQPHYQKANPTSCAAPSQLAKEQDKNEVDQTKGSLQSLLNKPGGTNPGDLQDVLMNIVNKLQAFKAQAVAQPDKTDEDLNEQLSKLIFH